MMMWSPALEPGFAFPVDGGSVRRGGINKMANTDPLKGRTIHIGKRTRTMKFTFQAQRIAQKQLGGLTLREALRRIDGTDTLCELAAAGFNAARDEGSKLCSADKVAAWLEAEPTKFGPLMIAVAEACAESLGRTQTKGEEEGDDEQEQSTTPTTTTTVAPPQTPTTTDGQTSDE